MASRQAVRDLMTRPMGKTPSLRRAAAIETAAFCPRERFSRALYAAEMVIMSLHPQPNPPEPVHPPGARWWRFLPLLVVLLLLGVVVGLGWHRELSFATLIRHRATIDGLITNH